MHWFLKLIILPLLDALDPKVIVEVGVEVGAVTRPLLEWALEHDAVLHSVDPDPNLNVDELIAEHGERLRFHCAKSLQVLEKIEQVDVALIDGDHNWYTVINELRLLERRAGEDGLHPPLVLLHDVGWPYGRRDLYYDPASIPEAQRQPHARRGIVPGQAELGIGLNDHLENALLESTTANGVLTAVEDFVCESTSDWRCFSLPGLSGLAILATGALLEDNHTVAAVLAKLETPELLRAQCEAIEQARIQAELKRVSLSSRLAQAQLKQVMRRVDPEELVALQRRVRELEEDKRELLHAVQRGEEAQEQLRILEAEAARSQDDSSAPTAMFSGDLAPHQNPTGLTDLLQARGARLTELEVELELANAQSMRLRSALARSRADTEIANAERQAAMRLLAEHQSGGPEQPDKTACQLRPPPDATGDSNLATPSEAELAAAENEREARVTFLAPFLELAESALPDSSGRDPLALPSPLDRHNLLLGDSLTSPAEQAPGQPSVDVVVCVHNALEQLRLCLWSLMSKTNRRFRLILVDDGSDPATRDYLDALVAREPLIVLVRREQPPHGYTLAANAGLMASTADYVVLLNSDTVVSEGWLERLIDCGERNEQVGILGPLSNAASHQSVPALREGGSWSTNPPPSWLTVDAAALALRTAPRVQARLPFLNGFCYAIKRTVIDAIGYLDEERFPEGYCEENDYSQRARDAGFELAVVDDAYVYHAKSSSYGSDGRERLAKTHYQAFRAKHGPERIDRLVGELEADQTLTPVRAAFARATAEPAALAAELLTAGGPALSMAFILPGLAHGGSGGSHSVYQEIKALRELGLPASILLPRWDMDRARAAYSDAEELFIPFADDEELAEATAQANVISATHYKSVALLNTLHERREDFLPAYYVQDYEPFFTAPYIAEEAIASYTAVPNMLLFAKSHWLCNVVAERHGLFVEKVEPSLDDRLFRPPVPLDDHNREGPLRLTAMIRPRTARRQPSSTVAVLMRLLEELPGEVELTTFGCDVDELREIAPDAEPIVERHLGLLSREQVAEVLRRGDLFLDMSIYQAFGRTALEAMACGCAVLAPATGGVWEFLEEGVNGLALDTLDRNRAFAALASLADNRERLESLKMAALRTAARYSTARAALSEYLVFEHAHRARFGNLTATATDAI